MKKINILGAGLSGLSAAINLAKNGFDVSVFELRRDTGARFEGDLQGLENWTRKKDILEDLRGMNIKVNFDYNPFKKVINTDGIKKFETVFSRPMFYIVKRGVLKGSIDQELKQQAIEEGVEINYNTKFKGKADIIATGPKFRGKCNGIVKGIIFDTDIDDIAVSIVNKEAAFKGYSYLLVWEGYACMSTVVLDKFHLVNKCFEKTKKIITKMFDLKIKNEHNIGGFGSFNYPLKLEINGSLFVGEASGLQDGLWGFGMRHAITSGYLAAKSIMDGISYTDAIKQRFDKQLKASIVNRFIWRMLDDTSKLKFITKSKDSLENLRKLYNFEMFYQKLIFPFAFMWINKKNIDYLDIKK